MPIKLAILKTGGKQYKVKPKDTLKVEKLSGEVGDELEFNQVLMMFSEDGEDLNLGTPLVEGAEIKAKILEQGRDKKVRVVHYKPKTRYHKVYGHRQPFTKVEIISV